jgi:cytoskeletal protein CcmA (bactofilin family)
LQEVIAILGGVPMKLVAILIAFWGLIAIVGTAACGRSAGNVERSTPRTVTVERPSTDDVVAAGDTVQIESEIQGDVATAGASVTIDGPVSGYAMAAGRHVKVGGRIDNDLWAAGETVTVDGQVGDTATIAGRNVQIGSGSSIGDKAILAGETVQVDGRVEHDLRIAAAHALIGGEVGGTVEARARRVELLPGAVINGDLVVRAAQPPEISPQARVSGQVRYEQLQQRTFASWPLYWLFAFLALLALGLPLLYFFPSWPARIARTMTARFGASFLTGVAVLIVVPIAVAVLAVTLVGIPLAVVLFALYVAIVVLSTVFVAYEVGAWLLTRMRRESAAPWQRLALGAVIVSLLMSLPAVGWLAAIAVVIVGSGALAIERRSLA